MTFQDEKYLHVYAPHMPHHEAVIVGNRSALLELRSVIDAALADGEAEGVFVSSDLEGYEVIAVKLGDEEAELFDSLEMPYTEQYGGVNNHMYFVNELNGRQTPNSPAILLGRKGSMNNEQN